MWGIRSKLLTRLLAAILVVAQMAAPLAHASLARSSGDPLALVCATPEMAGNQSLGAELSALLDEKQQQEDSEQIGAQHCALCVLLHAYAIPAAPASAAVAPDPGQVRFTVYADVAPNRTAVSALGARGPPSVR